MKKRLLASLLSATILLSMTPLTAFADDSGENPQTELEEYAAPAPQEQDTPAQPVPQSEAEQADPVPTGGTVIDADTTWDTARTLTGDLTINENVTLTIGAQVTVSGDVTISGGTIKRASAYTGSLLVVTDGSSLILANITIDGGAIWTGDEDETLKRGTVNDGLTADSALVTVNGGTLTLNEGTLIQNNERTVGTDVDAWIEWTRPVAQTVRYYAVGGGVSVVGGSLIVNDGAVVKNNTIKDSEKVNEATSDAMGGGIGLYDCASLVVNGGEISGNQAQTSGTARAMGGGIGMAAHPGSRYGSCEVCFKGGELKNNLSVTSGGGAYFTSDCEDETGINALDVSFSGGTISENKAGAGGGIIVWGGKAALSGDVVFTNNQAPGGTGGGAYFSTRTIVSIDGGNYSNNTSKYGGGIAWNGVKFEFRNGTVSNNSVEMTGGGLRLINTAETSAVISGGEISENTATVGAGVWAEYVTISGGTISKNHADEKDQRGGGVYVNHIFKLSGTGNITENSAYTGGGICIGNNEDSTFEITGGTISKNRATGSTGGGGVYCAKAVAAYMTDGLITENVAETGSGGGLYLRGKFELKGGTISQNSAPLLAGGGVNVYSGAEMVITDGTISGNEANEAAGIRVAGTLTMNGGTVEKNCAKPIYDVTTQKGKENNNGGGVSVGSNATFIMNAGLIQNNTAKYGAGISTWKSKQFEIHGGEISGNRTENMTYSNGNSETTVNGAYGAGINLGGNTTLLITGGKIINNTANSYGGGINVPVTEKLQISGTPIITENAAQNMPDNVYLRSSKDGKALIELKGNLNSGSTVGVKTEQTPTSSANTIIQITTAETDTAYYKDAARYFVPDAENVIAQANDREKYIELAHTTDTYYKVTLNLTHVTTNGSLTTLVKSGETYSAKITADTGYSLPNSITGVTAYVDNTIEISSVNSDKTIVITAVPNHYTVHFNANGGSGEMTDQGMIYDQSAALTQNTFTEAGYNFAGWSESEGGEVKYPDGTSVKNLTAEKNGNVTLYAIWTAKKVVPAFGDAAVQGSKYDGTSKTYQLSSDLTGFEITYKQGDNEVAAPTHVGAYDVVITRAEDDTYAAFSQTISGGLVITAADYPITITVDQSEMTGSGTVKLTAASSAAEITVTGVTCSDSSIVITKNGDGTYSAALPNSTKTYTFTAQTEGDLTNYGEGPATCTVTVTYQSHGGGGSSRGSSYAVSTPKADNGSVSVNNGASAKKGETVTITVKPNEGYEIDKVTVTDSKGNSVSVTDKGDGKYSFVMPDSKVDVKATFVKAETKPGKTTFVDVPENSWYAEAADFVAQRGLMSGVGENLFGGNQNTTRAMLMTILARMDGQDVTGGATWYEKAMNWAKQTGVSDGTMPEVNITREQLATMLYSYAKLKGLDTTQGGMAVREFNDYDSISSWAGQSMTWAVNAGILSGRGNNTLAPTAGATRAEMAVMLQQFVGLMEK